MGEETVQGRTADAPTMTSSARTGYANQIKVLSCFENMSWQIQGGGHSHEEAKAQNIVQGNTSALRFLSAGES